MSEQLDLTTPVVPPIVTTYTIASLRLDWLAARIQVVLVASDGTNIVADYFGTTAINLMTVLNSANLATKSLYRRVLEKLVADGKLPTGTVSGTAQ